MLAVRFGSHGGPEVLRLDDVPAPRNPVRDELLVRVTASSVNGTDLGLRRGDLRVATWGRLPFVPGFDVAGEVLRCGPAVTAFAPGDRVMALLGHGGGGQAEQVLLRQERAARVPASCSLEEAAALPLAGLTALQALHGKAGLSVRRAPARVLVIGAAGGIGSIAVQLAKLAGAHVTGVASGGKLPFVTTLGADAVVDYRTQDFAALGERWDVVLDAPGRHRFDRLRNVLTQDGILVSTRPITPDALYALTPAPLRRRGQNFAAVMTRARSHDLAHLAALVDSGRLTPLVDRIYPMAAAAAGHQHAEGPATGKVVIRIGGDRTD